MRALEPLVLSVVVLVACGPPKSAGDQGTETEAEAETSSGGDDGSTTEPSEDTGLSTEDTGTTGATDATTDDTDATTDPSLSFVPDDDLSIGCECDPFAQDCPEGEKCVAAASGAGGLWDSNICVPVVGSQSAGEPCVYGGTSEATDDCDADSACWDIEGIDGDVGTCRAFCGATADDPDCAEGQACLIGYEGSVNVCVQSCNPLLQDCAEGSGCIWSDQLLMCTSLLDDRGVGEPCYLNDCAEGLTCVNGEFVPSCDSANCCAAYCDLAQANADCEEAAPGTTCEPVYEYAPAGLEDVGVCLSPP